MAKVEYAHKVSNPIVGRIYRVAHAVIYDTRLGLDNIWRKIVPIHPHKHSDNQFAPNAPIHYHIDGRFEMEPWVYKSVCLSKGYTNIIVNASKFGSGELAEKIIFIDKKCVRKTTGILPPPVAHTTGLFYEWKESMKGKSCAGKKCPHYGVVMNQIKGQLVCPLHGLVGDIKTEIII